MGTQEYVTASAGDERDDLEKITGIGRYWANALYKVGITHFKDLAQYTPSRLSQLLEKAGFKASPEKMEKWIEEARERAWETHAEFSVFFEYKLDERGEREWQTRVYGEGEKKLGIQKPFPGIEPAPWVRWILEQAKLPGRAESVPALVEAAPRPAPTPLYDVQIEILGFELTEIKPSPDVPEKGLEAKVHFKVSGPEAEKLTGDRVSFQIEIYTVDLEESTFGLVASESGQLVPGGFEYESRQFFPVPVLGRYEMCAVVHLLPPGDRVAYRRGPTLTVVP